MDVEKLIPLFGKAVEKMEGWEEILQQSMFCDCLYLNVR